MNPFFAAQFAKRQESDFYYMMCKLGGIIVMIAAIVVAFKAF